MSRAAREFESAPERGSTSSSGRSVSSSLRDRLTDGAYPVTRFHDRDGHGWYVGRLGVWGLVAGETHTWPMSWEMYSQRTGIGLVDLLFACDRDRADFVHDIGL